MSLLIASRDSSIDFVLHPTDLSEASLVAFHHALAIGIRAEAQFTLLHAVGRRATDSWPGFPSVRDTLSRWRASGTTDGLEARIGRSSVSKVEVQTPDPVAACKDDIRRHAVDLSVLATESRRGLGRLLGAPRAERLGRESGLATLFVPAGTRPFVTSEGEVRLEKILVPVAPTTDAHPAMLFAVRSAALVDDPALEITLLHVGEGEEIQLDQLPALPYCRWNAVRRNGDAAEQIVGVAHEMEADAIVLSASWSRSRLGKRDGAVIERVLHDAACPVAAVPADAR